MSNENSGNTQPGQQPTDGTAQPAPDELPKKKRKLSLDIDQVDISEALERKISA